MRLFAANVSAACLFIGGLTAADAKRDPAIAFVDSLPLYRPTEQVTGTVTVWGHGSFKRDFMGALLRRWTDEFRRQQAGISIVNRMYGTASAIGALSIGAGNLALLGEEISSDARKEFQRAKGYASTEIQVATGSLDVPFFDYAHMIFVHRDNPLTGITLAQLDAIFGAEHRRGSHNARVWGDLGLTGEWADKPIRPYCWRVDEDFSLFFRDAVLEGSHRWNAAVKEFQTLTRPDGTPYEHAQQILQALAQDRFGIAVSTIRFAGPEVKLLPIAVRDGGEFIAPTKATLIAQRYPLTRIIPAFVDRAPGQPLEPAVREFLRFIHSREGQQALVEETGYLPLDATVIARQREKLQ